MARPAPAALPLPPALHSGAHAPLTHSCPFEHLFVQEPLQRGRGAGGRRWAGTGGGKARAARSLLGQIRLHSWLKYLSQAGPIRPLYWAPG